MLARNRNRFRRTIAAALGSVLCVSFAPDSSSAEGAYLRQIFSAPQIRFLINTALPVAVPAVSSDAELIALAYVGNRDATTINLLGLVTNEPLKASLSPFITALDVAAAIDAAENLGLGKCFVVEIAAHVEKATATLQIVGGVELTRNGGTISRSRFDQNTGNMTAEAKALFTHPLATTSLGPVATKVMGHDLTLDLSLFFTNGTVVCDLYPAQSPAPAGTDGMTSLVELASNGNAIAISLDMIRYVIDVAYQGKSWVPVSNQPGVKMDSLSVQALPSTGVRFNGHLQYEQLHIGGKNVIEVANLEDGSDAEISRIELAPDSDDCSGLPPLKRAQCTATNGVRKTAVAAIEQTARANYVHQRFRPVSDQTSFHFHQGVKEFFVRFRCSRSIIKESEIILIGNHTISTQ